MRTNFFAGVALAALMIPGAAFAQSTGSQDFENDAIIVTGTAQKDVGGVEIPDSPKAKVVLTKEIIERQRPGQTVNDIINLVPGVSFTNNDPWGSSGGAFTIRGYSSDRISQTFDGLPLNDSGNYALYTNQQVDPELIEQVNVNLGSTDVDSPTASAVGGTVNINTITPSDTLGATLSASYGNIIADGSGDRPYYRVFGLLQTGDFTGMGTKAWFSASTARNTAAYANYGKVDKQQYNGKIYQEIGSNGDFIAISGHYNENRNNFGGSPLTYSRFTGDKSERFYEIGGGYPCQIDTPQAGVKDTPNACGTAFERRYNPSNTGNLRLASKFSITDRLVLTLDGGFQYVKANGGGTVTGNEGFYTAGGQNFTGFFSGKPYYGRDLNGDGDTLDTVTVTQPSQTQTRRYTAIANVAYDITDQHRVRLSYTFDRARHRQTGETGAVAINGEPFDVFPVNDGLTDLNGVVLQKRDRKAFATLNQIAGEYRGKFMDDALTVVLGGRLPFFTRDLNMYCFTTSSSGYVDCIASGDPAVYQAAKPYTVSAAGRPSGAAAPTSRKLDYSKFLPNVGFTYNITPDVSFALSYAKNLSVPGTDPLYNSIYAPVGTAAAQPVAETSNSYDASLRYTTGKVQAAISPWYATYKNRLVSAYNLTCDCTIDTNLGDVKKYGVDANISVRPVPQLLLYAFGSYIKSEIQDDVTNASGAVVHTAGKYERGSPDWLFGGRVQATLGDLELGAQAKYTGSRFLNDTNTIKVGGYTVVDLDARYSLAGMGLEKTFVQVNLTNLFDEYYIGSFSGGLEYPSNNYVNFGAPRAISTSLVIGF